MGREIEKRDNKLFFGEHTQYALGLGVVGVMLYVIGLPAFVIIFLGAFSFFLWRLFGAGTANETRKIFEFYLSANEILRDDERRWYGFEMQDTIAKGEKILSQMPAAPPLLHFAIGALYHKVGDHESAEKHLTPVVVDGKVSEAAINYPSNELREYVRILRKIEREPAEAPQTSASVRSLERLRRNKGRMILEQSLAHLASPDHADRHELSDNGHKTYVSFQETAHEDHNINDNNDENGLRPFRRSRVGRSVSSEANSKNMPEPDHRARKPITEVLQDIYDDKVQ